MKTAGKKRQKKNKNTGKEWKPGDILITCEFRHEYVKELFRSLRTKILMGLHYDSDKSVVITSLEAEVGKTTMASNIAISIAQQDKKTVLIDGDLKRGRLHSFFGMEKSPGLSDFLQQESVLSAESISTLMRKTDVPNLFIIPSGEYVTNSSELLTLKRFEVLKQLLSQQFDITIIDTPPLGALTDAVVLNEMVSKYIVVVKAGSTNVVDMKKKIKEFPALEEKVLGLVLNYASIDRMRTYYKRSKYY